MISVTEIKINTPKVEKIRKLQDKLLKKVGVK